MKQQQSDQPNKKEAMSEGLLCNACLKPYRVRIGQYLNLNLFRGRTVTVRNVEVRSCGCQTYPCMGSMIDLLQAHPRKRVVTWNEKTRTWK